MSQPELKILENSKVNIELMEMNFDEINLL